MAKRDRSAEAWEEIARLKSESDRDAFVAGLCKHLADKAGVVVGKAAQVGLDRQSDLEPFVAKLSPILAAAFNRCMVDPVKTDPGCSGKIGIVNLGVALHCLEADLYLRAIRHVQREGSFGPPIDTAESLRAAAAYGLLNCRHADAMYEIVNLLSEVDKSSLQVPDSRRGAIRVLGTVVSETAAALLRMTALRFNSDPDTLSEVFASLNSIEANRSFDFIRSFLNRENSDVSDIAALALAEGKQPGACGVLLEHTRRSASESKQAVFTALVITRKPEAIEYLIDRICNGHEREAVAAIDALHLMRNDDALRKRVEATVKGRGGATVADAIVRWK